MDARAKYLEMIQSVISRMASNSFKLKGWAVTLVAGVFALAAKDANELYCLIAYIPVVVFWGLDAYYLEQEKLYRELYNCVREMEVDKNDFSLTASRELFGNEKNSWIACVLSKTELGFYFPLAIVCTVTIIISQLIK